MDVAKREVLGGRETERGSTVSWPREGAQVDHASAKGVSVSTGIGEVSTLTKRILRVSFSWEERGE